MTPDRGAADPAPRAEAFAPSAASKTGSDLLKDRVAAAVPIAATPQAAQTAPVEPAGGLSRAEHRLNVDSQHRGRGDKRQPAAGLSFDIKPIPTVSPQPGPITDPIEPTAQPTRNEHDVGTPKASASNRDAPIKVVGEPSMEW